MDLWKEDAAAYAASEITILKCDPYKELVWIGDAEGRIASFYGQNLQPYVSFFAHNGAVKDVQVSEDYILSLGSDGVSAHRRDGLLVDHSVQANGDSLLLLDQNEFIVGYRRRLKRFQLEPSMKETGFFEIDCIPDDVHLTRLSLATPNVAVGLSNGCVQVLEPSTFDPILPQAIAAHSGELTDLDSRKNIVVTCGVAQRRYGSVPDVFVSAYDTRAQRTLPPLSVGTGASFVRLHPKAPNHAVVVGLDGQITFLDSRDPSSIIIKQAIVQTPIVGIDIGPSGVAVVIAEKSVIHLWSTNQPRDIKDETFVGLDVPNSMGVLPHLSDDSPLSTIGMPYYTSELLSTWNPGIVFEVGMPTPEWANVEDPYLAQERASLKLCHNGRRRSSSVSVPRFLSEKARQPFATEDDDSTFIDVIRSDDSASKGKVPKLWRQLFVHYSKFGVDDFDFTFYNHTDYAGLEPLTASRFCNAILQLYRWCPGIYNPVLNTFARNNYKGLKTTGELAIVMDMLATAKGYHCRATNFMDILQLQMRTTELHKVLLEELKREQFEEIGEDHEFLSDVTTCSINSGDMRLSLKDSISRLSKKTSHMFATIDNDYGIQGLRNVVKSFGIATNKSDDDAPQYAYDLTSHEYTLRGYVAEIVQAGNAHAVAVINIEGTWHLFNDFLVAPISEADALDFSKSWKKVSVLMYSNKASLLSPKSFDSSWKNHIDTRLLRNRSVASGNLKDSGFSTEMLQDNEQVPSLVALDAEFVLLRRELAELHSDGSKVLLSPKKLSLARVSVVRDNEDVLIDDRIESKHEIVDYLTTYSGVEPSDLDAHHSKFALVAQQTATRRLWILLNLGTKFIGHALINDFRAINLYVPPAQVLDTYELFHDHSRNGFRRMSLKFLMWAVLGEKVQTGNHDSVQDAVSALRLYRKYQELISQGKLDEMLAEIAALGQKYGYRVPQDSNGFASASTSVNGIISSP